jgi:hypothetical protein
MKNEKVVFKGEIAVSVNNLISYDRIFEIETWMRRITFACLMVKFGVEWPTVFTQNELDKVEKKKAKNSNLSRPYESDNLIWFTTIGELAGILGRNEIAVVFSDYTSTTTNNVIEKLNSLANIRNDIAHNRIITIESLRQLDTIYKEFQVLFQEFRKTYIHQNNEIYLDQEETDNEVIKYFLQRMEDNDWRNFQGFIQDDHNTIELVHLPGGINFDFPYINLDQLLTRFHHIMNSIMGFFINKSGCEYCIVWSKHNTIDISVQKEIIDLFLLSKNDIWIDTEYKEQGDRAIFNPLFWFY